MCGRVFVRSNAEELLKNFAWARANLANAGDFWPRYNGAPGFDYPIIVRAPDEAGGMFVIARWALCRVGTRTPILKSGRSTPRQRRSQRQDCSKPLTIHAAR